MAKAPEEQSGQDELSPVERMVDEQVRSPGKVKTVDLLAKAKEMSPKEFNDVSVREFHGRYVLQAIHRVRKEKEGTSGGSRAAKKPRTRKKKAASRSTGRSGGKRTTAVTGKAKKAKASAGTSAETGSADRDSIRRTLLEFGTAIAGAETPAETMKIVSKVDQYVERLTGGK